MMPVHVRALVFILFASSAAVAQDSVLVVGTVVSGVDGSPLPYSTYLATPGKRRFSNSAGVFSFRAPQGRYALAVRQLGYRPFDTAIVLRGGEPVRLRFVLQKLAYRMAAVRTEVRQACAAEPRGVELSGVLEQVKENAEREQLLRQAYPFRYTLARTRRMEVSGVPSGVAHDTAVFMSNSLDPYRPSGVIREREVRGGSDREMRIPQLTDLANGTFLSLHCFSYGGIRSVDGRPAYRIDFEPSGEVSLPDVRGSVFLDTATFQIRRAKFALTRGEDLVPPVAGFEVTTTYRDLDRGLEIFDEIRSVQDFPRRRPTDPVERESEVQRLVDVHFIGEALTARGDTAGASTPNPLDTSEADSSARALRDSSAAAVRRTTEADLKRIGFYDRRARYQRAYFVGFDELRRRIEADSSNLLPELRWIRIGAGGNGVTSDGGLVISTPRCVVSVWTHGVLAAIPEGGGDVRSGLISFGSDLPPSKLAAIEIYPAEGAYPPDFRPLGGACGSVLLWTRAILTPVN